MGYEASYDAENDIVVLQVVGVYDVEDARKFGAEVEQMLEGKPWRQVMVDLGDAGKFSGTEARRTTAGVLDGLGITHLAMANARPAIRVMGKILVNLAGGGVKSRFFASTEQARAWLLSERSKR